jgi:rhodanese-related sulfurtransferase
MLASCQFLVIDRQHNRGLKMVLWSPKVVNAKLISPSETYQRAQNNSSVLLLDVRTQEEYNNELGHVANSILIPVQELEARMGELDQYKGRTIIAICRSGNRSGTAATMLMRHGFVAFNMEGGMIRWNEEGLPVQHDVRQ